MDLYDSRRAPAQDNGTIYITSRNCVTGVNRYRFFRNSESFGHASAFVMPDCSVSMYCTGLMLTCSRDRDMTLVPGISVGIFDGDCMEEYARVFWDGAGQHRLQTPFGCIQVTYQEGMYLCHRDENLLGALCTIQKGSAYMLSRQEAPDPDWEPRMALHVTEPLPDELALLLLSFPLVQLGP